MPRLKISLPESFSFTTELPVRITDINYGGHLGNDAVLSLIHEARMQFLRSRGLSELDFGGASLIMGDVGIEFKAEAFFGDVLTVFVAAGDFSRVGFDLYYKFVKGEGGTPVALAKTGMVCYNYELKKVTAVPQVAKDLLTT